MKNISWKLILVIIVVIAAVIYILPSIKQTWWPHKKINLGLDLQGGMHLVLEVDTEKALESTIERIRLELRNLLKKERIRFIEVERVNGT
ncbi:MAG: protein translocase subunit SecD, partial [Desulfobacterales bacterium]|nr:protein translocase subunit SecD [Desulfobacterales bacterium]